MLFRGSRVGLSFNTASGVEPLGGSMGLWKWEFPVLFGGFGFRVQGFRVQALGRRLIVQRLGLGALRFKDDLGL